MRLLLLVLAFLQAGPSVRFEKDGVRAGDKLFVGNEEGAIDLAKVPLQVSGRSVHNLSSKGQTVDAVLTPGGQQITLGPGIKLQREDKKFTLFADRGKMELSAGDKKLQSKTGEASFSLTATGFDFGKLGLLEGASLSVASTVGKK